MARGVVSRLVGGVRGLLRSARVEVQAGELRFTRPNQAVVETPEGNARFYEFADVVIATGSRPTQVPGLVPDGRAVLDSTDLLALTYVPSRLVVVGGGYIGLELGTAFAKLGSHVTIVEAEDRMLPRMDAALARPVLARMHDLGITLVTKAIAEGFDGTALRVRSQDGVVQVKADVVVVAVGRSPNTDQLGLDRLNVAVAGSCSRSMRTDGSLGTSLRSATSLRDRRWLIRRRLRRWSPPPRFPANEWRSSHRRSRRSCSAIPKSPPPA